jgi:hypothetical protein
MQRTRKGRNGRIAMRHTTKTTNIRPSIPRMRKKRGESWSTNKAGTAVTIAKIVSPIQSSIFSIQSNRRFSRQLYQHRRAGGGVGTAEPPQYRMLLAAVHESGNGTSRRSPVAHHLGRYGGIADMNAAATPFTARQYVSRTKFLPFSVDRSSYLPLPDRFGSLTFVCGTFL